MNRLELKKRIVDEGELRGIIVTECGIYDRGDRLDFYPTIRNETAEDWAYKHQVEELISDIAPIERPHKINKIELAHRTFKVGEQVEMDDIWIRLDAGEKVPESLIKTTSVCGPYRAGWVIGEVVETPEQNDRALGIKFSRDIYYEGADVGFIGDLSNLERLIREGTVRKIEKGQLIYCGTGVWSVRKIHREVS